MSKSISDLVESFTRTVLDLMVQARQEQREAALREVTRLLAESTGAGATQQRAQTKKPAVPGTVSKAPSRSSRSPVRKGKRADQLAKLETSPSECSPVALPAPQTAAHRHPRIIPVPAFSTAPASKPQVTLSVTSVVERMPLASPAPPERPASENTPRALFAPRAGMGRHPLLLQIPAPSAPRPRPVPAPLSPGLVLVKPSDLGPGPALAAATVAPSVALRLETRVDRAGVESSQERDGRVLEAVRVLIRPTAGEVADHCQIALPTAYHALRGLIEAGKVAKTDTPRGFEYSLVSTGTIRPFKRVRTAARPVTMGPQERSSDAPVAPPALELSFG